MTSEERVRAILELSRYTGSEISSEFIRKTEDHFPAAGIERIHNLIEGIYKPARDQYVFCIWSKSATGAATEIYHDILIPQPDGSWVMQYAAKRGDLESGVNRSLFACMSDSVPILVIVTSRASSSSQRARYKLLGPAIIENFDPSTRRFSLCGNSPPMISQLSKQYGPVDVTMLQMRNRLIMPFQLHEDRAAYRAMQVIRDQAFRKIILDEYRCQCAVCQSKFRLKQEGKEPLVEAEAAHIISVNAKGTDDPRNGLSLCRRHHWAFDEGLFTVTDGRTVKISPSVLIAERRRFDLEEYEGESIVPPANEICRPSEEALHWHQKRIFRRA